MIEKLHLRKHLGWDKKLNHFGAFRLHGVHEDTYNIDETLEEYISKVTDTFNDEKRWIWGQENLSTINNS